MKSSLECRFVKPADRLMPAGISASIQKPEPVPSVPSRDQPVLKNAKNSAELRREDQTTLCTACTPRLQGSHGGGGKEDKAQKKEEEEGKPVGCGVTDTSQGLCCSDGVAGSPWTITRVVFVCKIVILLSNFYPNIFMKHTHRDNPKALRQPLENKRRQRSTQQKHCFKSQKRE